MIERKLRRGELYDLSIEGDPHEATLSTVNDELLKALRRAGTIQAAADAEQAEVRVRHRWPPNWTAPSVGAWVLMQPWGYGTIPSTWINPIQRDVDEVWVPSEYVRKGYVASGIPAPRVHVVPYGVDTGLFHPGAAPWPNLTSKPVRFLHVGGAFARKGTDVLLHAYLEAFRRDDPVSLIIKDQGVGMFYAGPTVRDEIERARLDPAAPEIIHLSREIPHDQLPGLYTASTCVVHPYRGESFLLPIGEAMASGRPVVVTAGGPTDEYIPDDAAWRVPSVSRRVERVGDMDLAGPGWTLEPDHAALVAILKQIAGNPRLCEAKSRPARAAAERLTWDHMASIVIARARRLAGLPPRRTVRRLLGGRTAPVTYLACPDWANQQTVRSALTQYLERAALRLPSTLYLWVPTPAVQARCRASVADVLLGSRLPPEKDVRILSHAGPKMTQDAILSAVDALISCGGHAEQSWVARAKLFGRMMPEIRPLRSAMM
jgi:glycosyltransferase involved in cell wall biosynthesis